METIIVTDLKVLRQLSQPVASVAEAKELFELLKATLAVSGGCGLAAIQIGIPKCIAAVKNRSGEWFPLINPEIVETEDEFVFQGEGCLSLPGAFAKTKRFAQFTIDNQVIAGEVFRKERQCFFYERNSPARDSLECIAVQHEIGHFFGKLIIDFVIDPVVKVGRNDVCPCGSGKKFKRCCLNTKS